MSILGVIAFIALILSVVAAIVSRNWMIVVAGIALFFILAVIEAGTRL